MPWKLISCSAIGTSHQKNNLPCQDYADSFECLENELIIGAIADGAGSAKHSDLGSKVAVDQAIAYLKTSWQFLPEDRDQIFGQTLKEVKSNLEKKAKSKDCSLRDLACTLSIIVATSKWFAAMQIGDGAIVVKSQDKPDYRLLFMPHKGEYANQTVFITSNNAEKYLQIKFEEKELSFISLATDGIENISLDKKVKPWKASEKFFAPIDKEAREIDTDRCDQELKEFLHSSRINHRTDDDKTLLLAFYQPTVKPNLDKDRSLDSIDKWTTPIYSFYPPNNTKIGFLVDNKTVKNNLLEAWIFLPKEYIIPPIILAGNSNIIEFSIESDRLFPIYSKGDDLKKIPIGYLFPQHQYSAKLVDPSIHNKKKEYLVEAKFSTSKQGHE